MDVSITSIMNVSTGGKGQLPQSTQGDQAQLKISYV